ncbi:hypothetical protein DCAR_0936136 [Daucus carota subsp. sativus]|uniref:Uncharacterized protein n=1 Tax=Daucus carota subsp. sativus TaxID=79200 RepID=A0AAF0XYI8_DAUCS|nr:PREDICTED: uncharacterized protein LOC108201737 [Daucus carota subsp. sativus]WOH16578.1 hypothetical protein DCAR_0936136 [Daucus carota subsp. sativus]
MGCSKKDEGVIVESEAKKRVVLTEITSYTPLKPIFTRQEFKKHEEEEEENSRSTTPKSEESRVSKFHCPPAPRKRKTKPRCYYGGVREFFAAPPDFESLFIRHAEKA